jgi:hypothetical protein
MLHIHLMKEIGTAAAYLSIDPETNSLVSNLALAIELQPLHRKRLGGRGN